MTRITHIKRILGFISFSISISFFSCTSNVYLKTIKSYLNASNVETRAKYMAENYRGYFFEKKGDGKTKSDALESFRNWDGQLNTDIRISKYSNQDSIWMVAFNEQNDFSKMIGYPGWKGGMTITFDSDRKIKEAIYVPDSTNAPYKPYLKPAVEWLQKNRPAELNTVYQDNKLVQNESTAKEWVVLLKAWKNRDKN